MVTEEIITGLKNAVEHGEPLQDAMQIMMNSGYSPIEVQEASKYVGGGALHLQQANPEENLVMPLQKSMISNMAFWRNQKPAQQQPVQQPQIIQTRQFQAQQRPMQQLSIQQPQQFQAQQQMQKPQMQQPQQFQQQTQQLAQQFQIQQQPQNPIQFQQPKVEQFPVQQIPQLSPTQQSSLPLAKQLEKIKPPRQSYLKEIILLVILLALIGALIATILYKDTILGWFS
ncbi:MAG: hypothetical protein Q8N63_01845 [Nanoarchaeota archaeon]|nr:hypothetical protein [Nanoarchaeota archaeon]